jgi:hypothetical protein
LAAWLLAAENAGIVEGIWLSTPAPVENHTTRIYVAIHNSTSGDLEGTVQFRINDELLDTMRISALAGRIIESWADWVPSAGTSSITVSLQRTELANTASGSVAVAVVQPLTERTIFIDTDSDGDGVGNQEDTDDDNDGVSDIDELQNGTDPLVYNEPVVEPDTPPEADAASESNVDSDGQSGDHTSREHAGLERLVEAGPAQSFLQQTTEAITRTKENLDTYRAARTAIQPATTTTVTSTDSQDTSDGGVRTVISATYSATLAVLSWLLGYPGLVQLLMLLLLLYLIYRLARRLGRRPDC